jgi:CBS domain-containing protein
MSRRGAGAAVVVDPDTDGIGILTERDVLDAVGGSQDPTRETAADHLTMDVVFARPDWTLEQAAEAMLHGGFRHLVVLDGQDIAGLLSMRDIVRCWAEERTG